MPSPSTPNRRMQPAATVACIGIATMDLVHRVLSSRERIALSETAKENIVRCRRYLDDKMAEPGKLFYGINTGFGFFQRRDGGVDRPR